ncbi:hypothetical protein HK096_000092 [Nowakowskiella sp. JEL0078]|nr:hypothetical protein HK096_000092 [Nowakowskiella sp. JEL0078]
MANVVAQMELTPTTLEEIEIKIQSADSTEKKDLYLFQFLNTLEKFLLANANTNSLKLSLVSHQRNYERFLLKYAFSNIPKPTRTVRNLLARCLVLLFKDGDTKSLFDTIVSLQSSFTLKKQEDLPSRLAALCIIGSVMENHGPKRKNQRQIPVRCETMICITRVLRGAGQGGTELILKEIVKYAKQCLVDKVLLIRSVAAELLEVVFKYSSHPIPVKLEEYEQMISGTAFRALDGANYTVRHSVTSFMGTFLANSQRPLPIPKSPKKTGKVEIEPSPATDKTILSAQEMFGVLSGCFAKSVTRELRVGVIEAYAALLSQFSTGWIESNYPLIIKCILDAFNLPKLVPFSELARHGQFLLRQVIGKSLSETGQISAVKELSSAWLRKWPPVLANDSPPSPLALTCVMTELAELLLDLGSTATVAQDFLVEPAMPLLSHPSPAVNLALTRYFQALCFALPTHLLKLTSRVISLLQKDLPNLSAERAEILDRYIGYGHVLAGLIAAIPVRSLYISFETCAKVFGLSTQMLKSSGAANKEALVAATQIQVAWTLIGSLMTLGTSFVSVHISQLLLIWKTVFSKPSSKESSIVRTEVEWNLYLTTRESALAALHSFLIHNSELVTVDVAKRITVTLNNVLAAVGMLPTAYPMASGTQGPAVFQAATKYGGLRLIERDQMLRRRMLHCFMALGTPTVYETSHMTLLRVATDLFATDPEKVAEKGLSYVTPVPEKCAGAPVVDATVLTSLLSGSIVDVASNVGAEDRGVRRALVKETDVQFVEDQLSQNHFHSHMYDPHSIYNLKLGNHSSKEQAPVFAGIGAIDAAIEVFAQLFVLQSSTIQESILDSLTKVFQFEGGKISVGKKAGFQRNILVALIGATKHVMVKHGSLSGGKVPELMRVIAEELLFNSNQNIRIISCELIGRLSRVVGTPSFINPLIQNLVDQVVKNRDPDTRAGAALALGYIHSYVGGMAANIHLKNMVGILHSLAADPYPLVHIWALHSLWLTVESAGLMYGPFVNSTLSLIAKLYMSDSHEPSTTAATINTTEVSAVYPIFGRILYSLLGVVGPELSMSTKLRELFFNLYDEFKNDTDPFVVVEALKCIQHFILFASNHIEVSVIIPFLQRQLSVVSASSSAYSSSGSAAAQVYLIRKAAITCLYQLVQRNAEAVLSATNNQLEEQLFALLDVEPDAFVQDEIRDILVKLLQSVTPTAPSRWINLCHGILARNAAIPEKTTSKNQAETVEDDEEAFEVDHSDRDAPKKVVQVTPASVASVASSPIAAPITLVPRWRTQLFALNCVRQVMVVSQTAENSALHFDLVAARKEREVGRASDYLILRLPDLVRMAFGAATAHVDELRFEGLILLQDILERFRTTMDPDFEGHALLEQYQAQMSAALTPAFSVESSPEVTAAACRVCAVYVSSGINKESSTLSRVLKLLSGLLDQCKSELDN